MDARGRGGPAPRAWLALAVLASGCALQPYALFGDVRRPGEYERPPLSNEPSGLLILDRNATGEACSWNVAAVVAGGDGTIQAAIEDALRRASGPAGDAVLLQNVRVDYRVITYAVYSRFCTIVTGIAVR